MSIWEGVMAPCFPPGYATGTKISVKDGMGIGQAKFGQLSKFMCSTLSCIAFLSNYYVE